VVGFRRVSHSDEKQRLREIEAARKSVERCDAIRRGHLYPEIDPNKMKGIIPKTAIKYVRKDLQNATSELRLPTKFKTVLRLSNILQMITLPYFGILIATSLVKAQLPSPWNFIYSPYAVLPMVVLATMYIVFKQYVGRNLDKYVDERAHGQSRDRNLKEIAQQCIYELARQINSSGQDPKKFKFRIYHKDYSGISIDSKPGIIRNHYVAYVTSGDIASRKSWQLKNHGGA
jgi:hypothetical protein